MAKGFSAGAQVASNKNIQAWRAGWERVRLDALEWQKKLFGPEETEHLGWALGRVARAGLAVGLQGSLGAGKTQFVRGVARGLAIPSTIRITSPTYTLLNEYRGGRLPLYHADLYRIEAPRELEEIGLFDRVHGDGMAAVEWCEKFAIFPADHLLVQLSIVDERTRVAVIMSSGSSSDAQSLTWQDALRADVPAPE